MTLLVLSLSSTDRPRAPFCPQVLVLQAITLFELPYVHTVVFVFTLFTVHNGSCQIVSGYPRTAHILANGAEERLSTCLVNRSSFQKASKGGLGRDVEQS